jgi:RNA polymerase sigma-70 factor, ECF subfamily
MFEFLKPGLKLDDFHAALNAKSGRWYNACLRITRDAQLAEDAVQEALLKAWGQRNTFRGEADLDTWIHRIALNAAIDIMRRTHPASDEPHDFDQHADGGENSPEAAYSNRALGKDMTSAMERLTLIERECFVLKHLEGWRMDEIAKRQNTNVNNTKQTLFRAVKKLRADLNQWRDES